MLYTHITLVALIYTQKSMVSPQHVKANFMTPGGLGSGKAGMKHNLGHRAGEYTSL